MLRMRRLLAGLLGLLVLLGVGLPAASAAPALPEMEWSVLDRFGGDADGDGRLDEWGPLVPANLDVYAVQVRPSPVICAELATAVWRVDDLDADPEMAPGAGCGAVLRVRGEGDHEIEVFANDRSQLARVHVDDKLIVALGDSVAAGEGNPQGSKRWLDPPCHRSALAGFEVAARRFGEAADRRSVTFVSLACSGAEVKEGLLEPYAGIVPAKGRPPYAPQVERLKKIAAARPPAGEDGARVDAVLLSIGANDVHFSEIVRVCGTTPGDCRKGRDEALKERLEELKLRYERLDPALEDAAPGSPVLITEYFDPTRDEKGSFCRHSVGFTGQKEAEWAYEKLLQPLNGEVAAAATQHGWRLVSGIAADFERHGYCAEEERWVRRLEESALYQRDIWGTMHPSKAGHKAIAERVVDPLSDVLGFEAAAAATGEDDGFSVPLWVWMVAALLVLLLFRKPLGWVLWKVSWQIGRTFLLLRPTWPPDPVGRRPELPKLRSRRASLGIRQLLLIGAGVAVLFIAMIVLAGLVGRAILWLRFWSASLPADQAVDQVSGSELVSTGAVALFIFVGLGLAAAALAWLLDGKGRWVRTTRRGLLAIGLAEVLATLSIGNFRPEQAWQIFIGLVVAALLLHYLVEQAVDLIKNRRDRRSRQADPVPAGQEAWTTLMGWGEGVAEAGGSRGRVFKLAPFLFLAVTLLASFVVDATDRRLAILLPYLIAALLFTLPGGMAAPGVRRKDPDTGALLVPRVALALTGFAAILILLIRDEPWLAAAAAVAIVLGLLCLAVAAASGDRFAPYGLAVLISVPLFAGAAALLRGVESPQLQPVAVVLENGKAFCGAYVGESDGELWLARLVLDERAHVHRPRRSAIGPLPTDRIAAQALGSLEPVDLVEARALELREQLLDQRGARDPEKRSASCAPPETRWRVPGGWQRDLAEIYQPELVMARNDGFWPVPVKTLFSVRDRRASICRRVAGGGRGCLRLGTPGEFPWIGGEGESLEYPAADNDVNEQHDQIVEALGTADPAATAAEYFLVNRKPGSGGAIAIQYWFFYPFNYQPIEGAPRGGYHEGDFESIGVLLSARKMEPRYVWMARHNAEGRAFPWEDEALELSGEHPRVYAARGSHATYENCEGQVRPFEVKGLIDDHPTCDEESQLHLMPEVTPLINLSRVGWACWHGLFGHRNEGIGIYEGSNKFLIADAPKSPLWQQKFDGIEKRPCAGISDPGERDGVHEEVVEKGTGVPVKIRRRAGNLEEFVNDCEDWEAPTPSGIYMVACNQKRLEHYVENGLEGSGKAAVRIEGSDAGGGETPVTMPAVRRNRAATDLGGWRISAERGTMVSVFASCPSRGRVVAVRFGRVQLLPNRPLRIEDHGPGGVWLLTGPSGATVAEATPFPTRAKKGLLEAAPPEPGRLLACDG